MAKKHWLLPTQVVARFPWLRQPSWWLEFVFIRLQGALVRSMAPERAARIVARLFQALMPMLSTAGKIRKNLAVAFPDATNDEIAALVREISGNLGISAVELFAADRLWAERAERVEFVFEDGCDPEECRNKPMVLVNGHIGPWQIGTFIGEPCGVNITSVYAPEANPYLRRYFRKLRGQLPTRFISRDGCMRELTRVLRQGDAVGLVNDTRAEKGEPLLFFGVPTLANTAAARLALRHGCGFYAVRSERLPGLRYRVTVCRPIRADDTDAPVDQQAMQMTQKLFDLFEGWIREQPADWMCFSRRWPAAVYHDRQPDAVVRQ